MVPNSLDCCEDSTMHPTNILEKGTSMDVRAVEVKGRDQVLLSCRVQSPSQAATTVNALKHNFGLALTSRRGELLRPL